MKKTENVELCGTDLDVVISNFLHQAGVPAHVKGYYYVREAIRLSIGDFTYLEGITKVLYPTVAKHHKTTSSRVERAIRHAISIAWERGTLQNVESTLYSKPTNSEFIALVSDQIRLLQKSAGARSQSYMKSGLLIR